MRLHSIADRSGRGTVHSHKVDKIATTASLIPAIRAARIEPITAIRHE